MSPEAMRPEDRDAPGSSVRVLAVSDEVDRRIYSTSIRERMSDIDLIIGCGDVPASYLEFLVDSLNKPAYYVLGNHAEELTRKGERGVPKLPEGAINLGGQVVHDRQHDLILAGIPGSPRYSEHEPVQFTERQVKWMIARMLPRLLYNRLRYGRYLDVLVTHAPPRHVGDREDIAHQGFKVMRTFLHWFRPRYQLHGHIHLYDRTIPHSIRFDATNVINVYPYQRLDLATGHTEPATAPNLEQQP